MAGGYLFRNSNLWTNQAVWRRDQLGYDQRRRQRAYTFPSVPSGTNYATAAQGISGTNAETIVLANSNEWTTAYIYGTGWVASVAYNITAGLTNQWTHTATLQEAVTAGGTVTNGTVTIDAANARTNTYGGC